MSLSVGIVGDVAGLLRGVSEGVAVIQCPTTLLAMVDASVGGRRGVNLAMEEGGGFARTWWGCSGSRWCCATLKRPELPERSIGLGWRSV